MRLVLFNKGVVRMGKKRGRQGHGEEWGIISQFHSK
jgi:hypothetical protein